MLTKVKYKSFKYFVSLNFNWFEHCYIKKNLKQKGNNTANAIDFGARPIQQVDSGPGGLHQANNTGL